jgi:hypothetical protein
MNPDAIIPIVMVAVVGAVLFALASLQTKKTGANLAALGDKLKLVLDTKGRWVKKHRLIGELRGKPAEIFSYTTGSGKSQQRWVAISVGVKTSGGLTFSLKRRMTLFEFVARLFRKNETGTGNAAFDKKWVLITNQPQFMQTALLPEMREKIMRLSGGALASGRYTLVLQKVQYAEQGSFSSAKFCARFEEIAGLVCDLADVVEIGAELQK